MGRGIQRGPPPATRALLPMRRQLPRVPYGHPGLYAGARYAGFRARNAAPEAVPRSRRNLRRADLEPTVVFAGSSLVEALAGARGKTGSLSYKMRLTSFLLVSGYLEAISSSLPGHPPAAALTADGPDVTKASDGVASR